MHETVRKINNRTASYPGCRKRTSATDVSGTFDVPHLGMTHLTLQFGKIEFVKVHH